MTSVSRPAWRPFKDTRDTFANLLTPEIRLGWSGANLMTHKSWDDMMPEERRQDRLRHSREMLARWRGGRAKMWELTVSLKTLTIRIERQGVLGNLHVLCMHPTHIHGPVYWDDA